MLLVLGISGLGLLALPGWIRRAGRRLHPAEWARLSVVAVAGGAAVVEASALLYAAPVLAESSGVPALAQLCRRMLGSLAPGGQVAGWMAATVALTLPALGAVGCTRARRAARQVRVERGLGRHDALGAHELVVLPTAHLVAVSVPPVDARPQRGQIVVSDGLVDALAPDELDAVLRHEAAHLEHGHHRHLLVASVVEHAFAWFPPARRSTAALRTALERWADEEAAATGGDRGAVRQALLVVTASLGGVTLSRGVLGRRDHRRAARRTRWRRAPPPAGAAPAAVLPGRRARRGCRPGLRVMGQRCHCGAGHGRPVRLLAASA